MKQSRLMSLVEAVANVIVGYGVAVVTQILIFPIFIEITLRLRITLVVGKILGDSREPDRIPEFLGSNRRPWIIPEKSQDLLGIIRSLGVSGILSGVSGFLGFYLESQDL